MLKPRADANPLECFPVVYFVKEVRKTHSLELV